MRIIIIVAALVLTPLTPARGAGLDDITREPALRVLDRSGHVLGNVLATLLGMNKFMQLGSGPQAPLPDAVQTPGPLPGYAPDSSQGSPERRTDNSTRSKVDKLDRE